MLPRRTTITPSAAGPRIHGNALPAGAGVVTAAVVGAALGVEAGALALGGGDGAGFGAVLTSIDAEESAERGVIACVASNTPIPRSSCNESSCLELPVTDFCQSTASNRSTPGFSALTWQE